jgi:signal transduction histidine kinase
LVRLGDVANVEDTWTEDPDRRFVDGKPATIITVLNTVREDVIDISDTVHQYIDQFNRTHSEIMGSGLGLAIVKKIVDLYDDEINVESEKNKGTTIRIYLPGR